jgi:hypothetical protein
MTTAQGGGKVVSLTHRPPLPQFLFVDNLFNTLFGDVSVHIDLGYQVQIFSALSQSGCTVP